jgi:hypothetical protein
MTTLRQIEANRKNSLLSTGPRTEEGKEQSRRNALKHGLTGEGVVLAEDVEEAIQERYEQWAKEFTPATPYQRFLVEQIALNSVRLSQCSGQEIYERGQLSLRASICWDDDRRLLAEQLGQNLSKRPALVARQLERTPQGCDWLRERWEALGRILDKNGEWSVAERSLALDLLGTPIDLREDSARLVGDLNTVVRQEVDRLEARKEQLGPLDERERRQTFSGKSVEPDARLLKTRRYEAQIRRALSWSMAQYFRVTLGYGLSSPSLGFPVPERTADSGQPPLTGAEAAGVRAPVSGVPDAVVEPERPIAPEPEPELEPEPEPEPDLFATRDSIVPSPLKVADFAPSRLASAQGPIASALATPTSGNRRSRRARASQARRA